MTLSFSFSEFLSNIKVDNFDVIGMRYKEITKKLNKADLERIDAWEEIEMWFQKIRSIANGTYVKSVSER